MTGFSPNELITSIIDTVAQQKPDSIWLAWLTSEKKHNSTLRTITYAALSNAVNKVAWMIYDNVNKRANFETVAYIGPSDARYAIILYACFKAGYKVLFISPRNSLDAHLKLVSTCDCKTLITPLPGTHQTHEIAAASGMNVLYLPSLDELCADTQPGVQRPFPFSKTWSQAKQDPFVILHTSGTTGSPKPIVFNHEYFARCTVANNWPAPEACRSLNRLFSPQRSISLMPLFHVAGVFHISLLPLYTQVVTILPPPGAPPTSDTIVSILKHTSADSAVISPATVDCLGRNPTALALVEQNLQRLFYMGGVPTPALADVVAKRIELYSGIGSSECGPYAQLVPQGSQGWQASFWPYIQLNPCMNGRFEAHSSDLYELVLQRNDADEEQAIFLLFPDQMEYKTKDVFSPHPTAPDLWCYRGRVDDILVFSHGEKFNPIAFESILLGHPKVTGALMFGSGRFEAGLLVERNMAQAHIGKEASEADDTTDEIWQAVQDANKSCPDYATVAKSYILYTSSLKPMLRTGKGTVRRHATLDSYKEEIDQLYRRTDIITASDHQEVKIPKDYDALMLYLRCAIETMIGKPVSSNDTSLFEMGLNSLQTTRLTHRLRQLSASPELNSGLIYSNPTLASLAGVVLPYIGQEHIRSNRSLPGKKPSLERILKEYTTRIDDILRAPTEPGIFSGSVYNVRDQARPVILLTGSTGSIGSYVLDRLIRHPSQPHIYCLNRSAEAGATQSLRNKERDPTLLETFDSDRVTFLHADLSSESMGLEHDVFGQLLASVSLVIHNAWPVDFKQPLSYFKPSLDGVLSLVGFCKRGRYAPRLLFVSSVGVAKNLMVSTIPEAPIKDMTAAFSGYGQSKLVAELMFNQAAQGLGAEIAIARVCQVAGAADLPGIWNTRDWLPRLVMTSKQLGMIPDSLGADNAIDWIPIDQAADALIELSLSLKAHPGFKVFHVVNPHRTTWQQLLPAVVEALQEHLPKGHNPVQIVPCQDWISALRAGATDTSGNDREVEQKYPALPLIDFFEERFRSESRSVLWEIQATISASQTMEKLQPVQLRWMHKWARQWLGLSNSKSAGQT